MPFRGQYQHRGATVQGTVPGDYNRHLLPRVDTLATFALSKAVDRIQMYFLQLDDTLTASPMTRILNDSALGKKVVLMWSALGEIPSTGPVQINHFVRLVRSTPAAVDVYISEEWR